MKYDIKIEVVRDRDPDIGLHAGTVLQLGECPDDLDYAYDAEMLLGRLVRRCLDHAAGKPVEISVTLNGPITFEPIEDKSECPTMDEREEGRYIEQALDMLSRARADIVPIAAERAVGIDPELVQSNVDAHPPVDPSPGTILTYSTTWAELTAKVARLNNGRPWAERPAMLNGAMLAMHEYGVGPFLPVAKPYENLFKVAPRDKFGRKPLGSMPAVGDFVVVGNTLESLNWGQVKTSERGYWTATWMYSWGFTHEKLEDIEVYVDRDSVVNAYVERYDTICGTHKALK